MNKEIKINFLHVCENAFFDSGNKLCMNGIFDSMKGDRSPTEDTPLMHPSFFVVINISGRIFDQKNVLELEDPDGEPVLNQELKLNIDNKEKSNLIINLINTTFKKIGDYKIKFKVNDKIISPERKDLIRVEIN